MYARIHNGLVAEICVPIEGFSIAECFHPDIFDQLVMCSPDVKVGWTYNADTGEFAAPEEK